MNSLPHIHTFHIATAAVFLLIACSLFMARKYLQEACSETDASGVCRPSHKRINAFILVITLSFCEIFHTFKRQNFDTNHLIILSCGALLYSGIATVAQVMSIWKGGNQQVQPVAEIPPKAGKDHSSDNR